MNKGFVSREIIFGKRAAYGRKGMVATTNPYASRAGMEVMKSGGNAFDGAIAAAAALVVTEPTGCGLGSDAFSILSSKGKLYGINGSGYSPRALTPEKLKEMGHDRVPKYGALPVMVPGAVATWREIIHRFGDLPLEKVLEPAIRLAREGHLVQPVIAGNWQVAADLYTRLPEKDRFREWFDCFAPDGRAPLTGELWKSHELATTLSTIAKTEGEDFYRGDLARRIVSHLKKAGGLMTMEDLALFSPRWVEPLSIDFRGYEVWELPPNSQGLVALLALQTLENHPADNLDRGASVHRAIESIKLGFKEGLEAIGDPDYCKDTWTGLLTKDHGQEKASEISEFAMDLKIDQSSMGGTVYLAAADKKGNMISFIQSNYRGFGSGMVVPETGISLNNRGYDFSMDPGSPNFLMGGKRPFNTIIPGFLTRDGQPVGPFGVMGAYMQPQGHLQVLQNMMDFKMNIQEALDCPRWQWTGGVKIKVEDDFPEDLIAQLLERGHKVSVGGEIPSFGRGQIILRDQQGNLWGATEKRADSHIASW